MVEESEEAQIGKRVRVGRRTIARRTGRAKELSQK